MARFDRVIRGGMIVDGSRLPRFRGDIGIKDGVIAAIGQLHADDADEVIDAGGLIVAHTAWGMVTASARITPAETDEAAEKNDISLTPMAMPMLSGPGSIGVVMGLAAHADSLTTYAGMVIGIAALALSVYLFLRLGGPLVAKLGPGAVAGITRIFGFLIFAVAVQLVWDGVADFGK